MAWLGHIGEVMLFTATYVPEGWLPCDGRKLRIADHVALFAVIENRFGGDGINDYCLPDLRGVFPTAVGGQRDVGTRKPGANESQPGAIPIGTINLPLHTHGAIFVGSAAPVSAPVTLKARQTAGASTPAKGSYLGEGGAGTNAASIYVPAATTGTEVELGGASLSTTVTPAGAVVLDQSVTAGPVQPLQIPVIELQFCICIDGIFPTRG